MSAEVAKATFGHSKNCEIDHLKLTSMLKSCPSCSYIGNDGEHVCPFCKADLAVGRPRQSAEGLPVGKHSSPSHSTLRSSGGRALLPRGSSACLRTRNHPDVDALDHLFGTARFWARNDRSVMDDRASISL